MLSMRPERRDSMRSLKIFVVMLSILVLSSVSYAQDEPLDESYVARGDTLVAKQDVLDLALLSRYRLSKIDSLTVENRSLYNISNIREYMLETIIKSERDRYKELTMLLVISYAIAVLSYIMGSRTN